MVLFLLILCFLFLIYIEYGTAVFVLIMSFGQFTRFRRNSSDGFPMNELPDGMN